MSGYLKTVDVNINYLRTFGHAFSVALRGTLEDGSSISRGSYQSPAFNHTHEQWQKVAFQFTVPEDADYAYIYPRLYNVGEIYWDGVELYAVDEPPVAEICANHMYYTDLDAGIIELDFIGDDYAGYSYDIFITDGSEILLDNYMDFLNRLVPESYWYKAFIKNNQLYLLVLNHENEAVGVLIPLVSTDESIAIGNFTATVVDGVSTAENVSGNGTLETSIPAREAVMYKITPETIPDYSSLTGRRGIKDGETIASLTNRSYNLQGAKFAALYDISGDAPQLVKIYPAKDFEITEIEQVGKYMVKLFSWKGTLFEELTPEEETIVIE